MSTSMGYTQMLIHELNFEFASFAVVVACVMSYTNSTIYGSLQWKIYERLPNQTNDKYVENCVGRPGKSSFSFTGGVLGFNKYNGINSKRCG